MNSNEKLDTLSKVNVRKTSFNVVSTNNANFWNCLSTANWENDTFDVIDHFVKENTSFVDLGAWIGPLSLYAAKKGAWVYAIDPDPVAYQALLKNVQLNPDIAQNIKTYNIAIANTDGERILHARDAYGRSSSSLLLRVRDGLSSTSTQTYTLNSFLKNNELELVDLLKIDIEGGEFELWDQLRALKKTKKIKTLLLSLHYDHLNEMIYQQKINKKLLSLVLMKLEKKTGYYFFKKELIMHLSGVVSLAEAFKYLYTSEGKRLNTVDLPAYLLSHKINLLLTDEDLNEVSFTDMDRKD